MHDPDNQRAFDLSRTSAMIASPVYYASLLGLGRVLHELLNSKQVENVMTDFVPLRFTSESAEVNIQGGFYGYALQAALVRGDGKVVEFLVKKGANFNARGRFYGNAL